MSASHLSSASNDRDVVALGPLRPLALLALVLAGCAGGAREDIPPPGLEFTPKEAVEQQRAAKDASFRTDPDSPIPPAKRTEFRALEYYPFAAELRFKVKLRRYPTPLPITIVTTQGKERPAAKVGYVEVAVGGRARRLQVYQLRDLPPGAPEDLFLPFLDETSGVETYGAGRYVELAPGPDGWYLLDFNLAYHPLCAYGRTDYRCPRTPEENRLPFPVRAGERGWAAHGAASGKERSS
jgi:hypothetical protein